MFFAQLSLQILFIFKHKPIDLQILKHRIIWRVYA